MNWPYGTLDLGERTWISKNILCPSLLYNSPTRFLAFIARDFTLKFVAEFGQLFMGYFAGFDVGQYLLINPAILWDMGMQNISDIGYV